MPTTCHDPFTLAVLWTGSDEACLNHDTALAAFEVSDVNPGRMQLTVAKHRRIRRFGVTRVSRAGTAPRAATPGESTRGSIRMIGSSIMPT